MKELFVTVLNMSLTASIAAFIVMAIRIIIKKTPKIFSYMLWSVVLFRLLIPYTFETDFSLMPKNSGYMTDNLAYLHDNELLQNNSLNNPVIPDNSENINNINNSISKYDNNPLETQIPLEIIEKSNEETTNIFIEAGSIIWIIGVLILVFYNIIAYIKLISNLSTATLVGDDIYETDRVKTPFVIGFVKPRIIIPTNLKETELKYILMHENTHIRRKDNIIKPIAFLSLIIHWFNPVIWLSYYLMVKDMEMSCDESVMNKADEDIRRNYSFSLLSLSVKQRGLLTPLAFGESNVKSRIKNILNYKRPSFWVIIMLIILLIVTIISIGTNPKKDAYKFRGFGGVTSIRDGDSYFLLEDSPKSIQEELVYLNFLYTFEKKYDEKYEILADTEPHRISIENEKKIQDPNIYTSYVLHNISTVIDKQSQNVEDIVKQYNLSEYEIINVFYTQKHSTNKLLLGPQWGDGTYSRNFVVGKSSTDRDYKIYEFLMPVGIADSNELNSVILSNSIQIYNYENYELTSERTITDPISKINITMLLRNGNTSSIKKSTSDVPSVGHYIKVVLNGSEENYKESGTYYVYEINSRYYVEIPNEHISDIAYDEYRGLSNYNRLGTMPNPIFISTIVSNVTEEDYKSIGTNEIENPSIDDFKRIQFKLYIEYPLDIKSRKVEIPNFYIIKKNDEENRYWSGSSFEQDNEGEYYAIYEQELIMYTRGLDNKDIIDILKTKEASVSWIDKDDNNVEFKYNIGDIAEIYYKAERDIEGEYVFDDLSHVSLLSSTFWTKESRENIRYIIDKNYFSIEPGDNTKWHNIFYKKEEIDSAFVQANYGGEFLAGEYNRIFFSKSSKGYRYIISDVNNNEIDYHIFQIGEDTYVCETYEDYKKNGFVKVEKVKKVK